MTREPAPGGAERVLSAAGRLAAGVLVAAVALGFVVLGFFFLAAAVVAGGLVAVVMLLRLRWLQRRVRKAKEAEILTTEYTVVKREGIREPRLPPTP